MKRALVYYLYGNRNAGDMAICIGTIEYLRKQNYEITMVSRFSEKEEEYWSSTSYLSEYYPDVKVYPGPFSFERDYSVVKKIFSYAKAFMKAFGYFFDKQTKDLIRQSDVVFFNGGNLLRGASMTDYLRLIALFYPIRIARKEKKLVYCLPQSTAKISKTGEKLMKKYLSCFEEVFVREKESLEKLKKSFPLIRFQYSTDMAFLCNDTELAAKKFQDMGFLFQEKTVAIVVRNTGIGDIGEMNTQKQTLLKEKLFALVKTKKEQGYDFLVVVQTKKDKSFSKEVFESIKEYASVQMVEEHDPLVLREIYKRIDVLITMRLHAGILSLSARTPVIGIFSEEWGLKNPGIMNDYGMPFVLVEQEKELSEEVFFLRKDKTIQSAISERINRNTSPLFCVN